MKNISLQIFWKLLCLHITHSWFHLFLLQCFQSQHTQTGTFSLFPRWLSYHSLVATTVRFHISQLINVRFYWWTKLFIDWRTPKFSKLIYFPNWSYIQNQKYLFDILFSIHLLLVLKNDEDVAWWALYCHVFLKLLTVYRSVANCCEVLNEHYLFWFHLVRHVVLESNFYRISSCLQSRRFPEDPRVGHQSAGRQNHQCLLSWGVSCPCYLSAVFGNLVCFFLRSVRYGFESHPPQIWTRPSGFSVVAAWLQRGSVFSSNSVFEKSQLGFFYRVVWLFNQSESWKPDVFRCIIKMPKSQMRRHLNVSHSFYWLQMHSCCTVFWLLCFKKNLRIEVESVLFFKKVLSYDQLEFSLCCSHH